jgi:DNA-binding NtrC family response regulator
MASITISISNPSCAHVSAPHETRTGESLIFVVDDNWSTRRFLCTVLRHTTTAAVREAASPAEALSMARAAGRPVDVLISDISLSADMNGIDLAREIATEHPAMRVLLISGGDVPEGGIPTEWRFLAKPFPLAVFLDCVHELCPAAVA